MDQIAPRSSNFVLNVYFSPFILFVLVNAHDLCFLLFLVFFLFLLCFLPFILAFRGIFVLFVLFPLLFLSFLFFHVDFLLFLLFFHFFFFFLLFFFIFRFEFIEIGRFLASRCGRKAIYVIICPFYLYCKFFIIVFVLNVFPELIHWINSEIARISHHPLRQSSSHCK